jgi:hypothetical protein
MSLGMNARTIENVVDAVLGMAVLIVAPLILLAFWNHISVGMVW